MSSLREDLLPNLNAIAEHVYGEATPSTVRRLRHLIAMHGFPHKKVGGKIESRRSWIDQFYASPDRPNGREQK
jgi:hypothetical protein